MPTTKEQKETDRLIGLYGLGRDGHSHFSPSGSAGWLNCSGFLLANAKKPDMAGYDAAYGTVAHEVAAEILKTGVMTGHVLGDVVTQDGHKVTIDEDMLFHIEKYVSWCREALTDHPGADAFVETHIDYSEYTPIPNQGGTADHVVCSPGLMVITDLKMGTGVRVYAKDNTQAQLYALGFFLEYDWAYSFKTIIIRICQPRLDYFGIWAIDRETLLAFGEYVRKRAALAWRENALRTPSPKACQWCADIACPARSKLLDDIADDSFDTEEVSDYNADELAYHVSEVTAEPKPPRLSEGLGKQSTALLAARLRYRSLYEKWFRQIYETLLQRVLRGEKVPGFKHVDGRRSYKWMDEKEAVATILKYSHESDELRKYALTGKDLYHTEVVSVATVRKMLKTQGLTTRQIDEVFFDLEDPATGKPRPIVKLVPGKPALALDTDERLDEQDSIDDSFDAE